MQSSFANQLDGNVPSYMSVSFNRFALTDHVAQSDMWVSSDVDNHVGADGEVDTNTFEKGSLRGDIMSMALRGTEGLEKAIKWLKSEVTKIDDPSTLRSVYLFGIAHELQNYVGDMRPMERVQITALCEDLDEVTDALLVLVDDKQKPVEDLANISRIDMGADYESMMPGDLAEIAAAISFAKFEADEQHALEKKQYALAVLKMNGPNQAEPAPSF